VPAAGIDIDALAPGCSDAFARSAHAGVSGVARPCSWSVVAVLDAAHLEDEIDQSFGERLPSGVGDGNQTRRLSADPAVAALPWA
jgi:hypothetical protein